MNIIQGFLDGLRPNISQTVTEWANENITLTSDVAAESGKYRSSKTPYMEEIMDSLSPSSPIQEVYFMKGVQIAGTQSGLNVMGCYISNSPRPIMYVMPTIEVAKVFSKTKLNSLIENSTVLKSKIANQKERDGDNTILQKNFIGGYIKICGANSASSLRSNTIGLLICDETDAYPNDVDGEGSPISLAMKRLTTFGERKKFYGLSTPLVKDNSYIEKNFLNSDQRKYFIPCPFCQHLQHLEFRNLKWEKEKYETVKYECQKCFKPIDERYKTVFLSVKSGAKWMPTNKTKLSHTKRGYHLNSLYSPLGWMSWSDIVKEYEEKALKDVNELRVFTNTILAETFAESGESPDWEILYNRRGDYKFNIVPNEVAFLTAGVDIQGNRIELEIVGWCKNMVTYSIDYRVIIGDTSGSDVWDELALVVSEKWKRADTSTMPLKFMCVDSGYNQQMVYAFCNRFSSTQVVPIKGQDKQNTIIKPPISVSYNYEGKKIGDTKLWNVGSSVLKGEIYGFLKNKIKEGIVPYGYCHFPQYDETHFKNLTAEELKYTVDKKGKSVQAWVLPSGKRNEQLDCRNYARAAATIIGIDNFTNEMFDDFIGSYGKTPEVIVKKQPKPNKFWDK